MHAHLTFFFLRQCSGFSRDLLFQHRAPCGQLTSGPSCDSAEITPSCTQGILFSVDEPEEEKIIKDKNINSRKGCCYIYTVNPRITELIGAEGLALDTKIRHI